MSKNLQLFRQEANGQLFKDPSDPDYTVRVKANSSQKTVNGVALTNDRVEIVINDQAVITSDLNDNKTVDAKSIRISFSANPQSYASLVDMFEAVSPDIRTWLLNEHAAKGFPLVTLPKRPTLGN